MPLKYGKAEIAQVAEAIDQEHASVEDAALACLAAMEEIFEKRAKFTVVGQLLHTSERRQIPPDDPAAIKVALGWYSTEGDARTASEGLWSSTATGDVFRTWQLDVHHGSPAEFHAKQKAKLVALAEKRKAAVQERMVRSIEKQAIEAEKRAAWWRETCSCGHERGNHRYGVAKQAMRCFILACRCPDFDLKT